MSNLDVEENFLRARIVARLYHEGQMYGEHPYTYHLESVSNHFDTYTMKTIAYLHDILEDTDLDYGTLKVMFGAGIACTVEVLTRLPEEDYKDYIYRVEKSVVARAIKIADLEENIKNNDNESLVKRYTWALNYLRREEHEPS